MFFYDNINTENSLSIFNSGGLVVKSSAQNKIRSISYARYGYFFIIPFFVVYFIFQLVPLINTFRLSLYGNGKFYQDFVGMANFKILLFGGGARAEAVQHANLLRVLGNTLILWFGNFIPQLALSLLLAVWFTDLNLKIKGKTFFKIVMYLPKDYDGNINIKSNVGRVGIDNFVKASIDIDSDVADIDIYEVKNLKVRLNVGDIQVGSINNSLDLNTDVASVNITTVNIKEDSRIKVNVGDVTILNTNDIYIDGETKTGTVKIYKNNHEADITLKIRNDVGDIEVYNDEIINDDVKLVSELEEYKKLDLEKIDSIEVIKYTEGGDNHEEMTEVEDIKKYYELIGSTKLCRETPESCEDNTTVYVFKMGKDKVSFEFECGNFVYNGKRYIIKK